MNKIDKKEYLFLIIFFLVIFCVSIYRYYDYFVNGNFLIYVATSCNPLIEDCFVYEEDENIKPYKKITILAKNSPECLIEHNCPSFECKTNDCITTYCSEENIEEGETCIKNDYQPTFLEQN